MNDGDIAQFPDSDGSRLWSVEDVAAYFGISERTLREWREVDPTFPLPLDLPGRTLRWYPPDVVGWVSRCGKCRSDDLRWDRPG